MTKHMKRIVCCGKAMFKSCITEIIGFRKNYKDYTGSRTFIHTFIRHVLTSIIIQAFPTLIARLKLTAGGWQNW